MRNKQAALGSAGSGSGVLTAIAMVVANDFWSMTGPERMMALNTFFEHLGLIAEAPGLCDTPQGEKLAQELEYRICLSATISNALFGLTGAPGAMADRMRQLAGAVVDLLRGPDQAASSSIFGKPSCKKESARFPTVSP